MRPSSASSSSSLLFSRLPSDWLSSAAALPSPESPSTASPASSSAVLNLSVNHASLYRRLDAEVAAAVRPSTARRAEGADRGREGGSTTRRAKGAKGSGCCAAEGSRALSRLSRARPPSPTLGELVDRRCAELAAYNHQQQLSHALSLSQAQLAKVDVVGAGAAGVSDATAVRGRAHRYRLYTDRLISLGLHHEAELRRQWVDMEAQAHAINRSAERAARKDARDSVREMVAHARAGQLLEAREKEKEAAQHCEEANEARSSRRAIYDDPHVHLPLSRLQLRQKRAAQARQGDANTATDECGATVGALSRQPLFDPTPNHREFDAHRRAEAERQQMPPVCIIRGEHSRVEEALALPRVVGEWRKRMEEEEAQQQLRALQQKQPSQRHRHLHHHRTDTAKQRDRTETDSRLRTQRQRMEVEPTPGPQREEMKEEEEEEKELLMKASPALDSAVQLRPSTSGVGGEPPLPPPPVSSSAPRLRRLPPPPAVLSPSAPPPRVLAVAVATSGLAGVGVASSAATRRRSRAALLSQRYGDALLRDVRLFTVRAAAAEEAKAAAERLEVAEQERRMKEQWMEEEVRENREREQRRQPWQQQQQQPAPTEPSAHSATARASLALPAAAAAALWPSDASSPTPSPPIDGPHRPGIDVSSASHPRRSSLSMAQPAKAAPAMRRSSTSSIEHSLPPSPASSIPSIYPSAATSTSTSLQSLSGVPRLDERRRSSPSSVDSQGRPRPSLCLASSASASPRCSSASSSPASSPLPRSSLFSQSFSVAAVRSRWQSGAGMSGKEHLARRFSLVAPADALPLAYQGKGQARRRSLLASHHLAAMLPPAPSNSSSSPPSLVATNSSHDPLHSPYLQQQREQRRHATAAVYDTVKRWLEEQEESKRTSSAEEGPRGAGRPSLSLCDAAVTPFSSLLTRPPYSPRTLRRDVVMRQQLSLPLQSGAVMAWLKKHRIPPRRTIDPSSEVKYRQIFNEIDRDASGLLDTEELLSALRRTHGLQMSEEELTLLLSAMDIPYTGHLSFTQFVSQFASMDEWESLFKVWARRRQERQRQQSLSATRAQQPTQPHAQMLRPATATQEGDRAAPTRKSLTRTPASLAPAAATCSPSSAAASYSLPSSASSTALRSASTPPAAPPRISAVEGGTSESNVKGLDVDVLVPFLLWVPAFHRLRLLESLMSLQLTAEEETVIRSVAQPTSTAASSAVDAPPSLTSASSASAGGAGGTAGDVAGLSLLDLWRVTRTQVRRKRLEAEKAEVQRLAQMRRAQQRPHSTGKPQLRPATASARSARDSRERGGQAEEEQEDGRVSDIWRELREERERRVEDRRRWKELQLSRAQTPATTQATRDGRQQPRAGGEGGSGGDDDDGQGRALAVFHLFAHCRPPPPATSDNSDG